MVRPSIFAAFGAVPLVAGFAVGTQLPARPLADRTPAERMTPLASRAATRHVTAPPPGVELSAKERLGKSLFEDPALSEPAGQSCASCHDPRRAFTGDFASPVHGVARGARGDVFGTRNVPSAMYLGTAPPFSFVLERDPTPGASPKREPVGGLFWDGRAHDLAAQAKGPLFEAREMNNASAQALAAKVTAASYAPLAREVYGSSLFAEPARLADAVADAVAAFERTRALQPFASKFDAWLRGATELTAEEARGFALFKDPEKGNCMSCHRGEIDSRDPAAWLFTDFSYDNLGIPRNRAIPDNADPTRFDLGLCARPALDELLPPGERREAFCGAFKVPTLRNIARTAPYMHNGYFDTLRDVVRFYATRDAQPELWYPRRADGTIERFDDLPPALRSAVNTTEVPLDRKPGERPRLDDDDVDAVVAFLLTLTDRE